MYMKKKEKRYYRFPSITSVLEFEDENQRYFPIDNKTQNHELTDLVGTDSINGKDENNLS